jgi:PAS domain S-box-containing protein
MNEKIFQSVTFWKSFGNIFPSPVVIIKETGDIVYGNNVCRDLMGLTHENLFNLMNKGCLAKFNESLIVSEKEKKVVFDTLKIKESDARILHLIYYLFPLENNFFVLILTDNTDLNNELRMLNDIINTVSDPIFVKDDQFRFLYLNQACAETWGLPAVDILGKNNDEFFSKEESDVFNKIDIKTFKTGKTTINEEKFTRIEGNTRIISTKKSVFKTLTGSKILVGVSRDVTEINKAREYLKKHAKELKRQVYLRTKQLELKTKDLEAAVEKLKSLNSDLDCFAHICCHELREPLRTISSFSKLAFDEYSEGKNNNLANFLQIIHQGSLKMDKLIKSILAYSTNGLCVNSMSLFSSDELII